MFTQRIYQLTACSRLISYSYLLEQEINPLFPLFRLVSTLKRRPSPSTSSLSSNSSCDRRPGVGNSNNNNNNNNSTVGTIHLTKFGMSIL